MDADSLLMDRHQKAVANIAEAVKGFYNRKEAFHIYHGSTNSTRSPNFDPEKVVDTSSLSQVLQIDAELGTVLVEPNVSMDRLVQTTLKYGFIPQIVPEFPGITVGGSFSGTAGESSSFKYGFFDRTVNWCDMVLANGDLVRLSPSNSKGGGSHPDLYNGAVGTFGTLGVTTLFEIQLVKACPYVEITYVPVKSTTEIVAKLQECITKPYDFIDGILFSKDQGVVIVGVMTGSNCGKIVRFARAHDPWFYLHAFEHGITGSTFTVPIFDYLFRYDRGAFWMGSYTFSRIRLPFNRLTRWLLNPAMKTRSLYRALHASDRAQKYMIQDIATPASTTERFLEFVESNWGIYPLWLCPIRSDSTAPMHQIANSETIINVGVWGLKESITKDPVHANRALEKRVQELGGWKVLYAHTYYTEDEFWRIHGKRWYDELREKYFARHLPTIYDKVGMREKAGAGTKSWSRVKTFLIVVFFCILLPLWRVRD